MSTTTEQNKAVIRRFFDAWNSRQAHVFDDLIAPDVIRHCEATPGVQARSLDQVKEFLRQDTAVFPDSVQTVKLLIAEDNLVAAWTTYEGTQQGPMGPFPPSGRKAQFDFGAVFRIEDGKIAEWWVTWDNMRYSEHSAIFQVAEKSGKLNPIRAPFNNAGPLNTLKEITLVPAPERLPVDAASRSRAAPSAPFHFVAKYGIRGVIGSGSAEGGAAERRMIGFREAYKRRGIELELGGRLALGYQFHIAPRREQAIRDTGTAAMADQALASEAGCPIRREHEMGLVDRRGHTGRQISTSAPSSMT